jgi:hypothetical protein
MGLPYGLILVFASIGLSLRYVALPDTSNRWKCIVCGVEMASLLALPLPLWPLVSLLLQLTVSLYVLMYLRTRPSDRQDKHQS